ncbi:fumarylacetoacetate hydrolase family protein [Bordetella bronchialis]|uniref:2-hydroxyhepta-2,4-diene-1,7-dioate isomerase n=1 Tax=Bordetella bronchialis TaxID=463025 RepID=A0ABN4RC95_9BORD|nr:fumarylacetoacetate hydrolase family protein [Bordetella bronchialis]ANN68981.1 2-hydroxyhepta-2,4-diene-1,7-dioate isomerase [Bordetella bronchialis]
MKLVRWGRADAERPGMLDAAGRVRDLSGAIPDIDGKALADDVLARIAAIDPATLPLVPADERLGPCVAGIGKIVCIGLNYRDHAREANLPQPKEPIVFLKPASAVTGPTDPIRIPPGARKVDWEVELGVVIGKTAINVAREDALSFVAGYCVVNDVSERAWQMERGGQWDKGKAADTFCPVGPWLVTRDEIPDPQRLAMWLEVDGVRRQNGTSADMIFGVAELVAYVSGFMSLRPGDIIATGTPAGVGMGCQPPVFLRAGQSLRLGVEGLGVQHSPVRAAE